MRCLILAAATMALFAGSIWAANEYPLTEDSKPQEGVPKGEVKGPFKWNDSKIYPGTEREYYLYIPAQYDANKPHCVFVLQDGIGRAKGWNIPTVLDNLIHKGEVPPQIGIFIGHGIVPAANDQAQPRFNRSYEYDAVGDKYARFLLEEILPAVAKDYNLSTDPNDRAIGGASSGAICAFNVAWERPNEFRRVYSTIGTYVSLRGADALPRLIRKYETKPIRVFLQDGANDLDIYAGDWFIANQDMLSALKYSGYEVEHAWGEGGHDGKQSAAVTPDALRFLWKDYPAPIGVGHPPKRRTDIVIPGEGWQLVAEGFKFTEGPAINEKGELYFTDIPNGRIHKLESDGTVSVFAENSPGVNGLMFGPDGKLYACQNGTQKIVRYTMDGQEETVCEGAPSNDLIVLANGSGYFTDPGNHKVWHFSKDGKLSLADEGIAKPNGIIASPDQTLITVADTDGRFTYSYQVQPDGKLAYKQTYGHLHVPDDTHKSGADGMTVDTEGRIYVTTRIGLQVMDQLGRVHIILDKPGPGWLSNAVFGGPDMDTLYVTCGQQVFKRKVKAQGVYPFKAPVMPPRPGL
ncbi:MAG: SMP-30/gluconolactonase/LRE family protein [Planctomycetaceae bacterium]|nr:SMP-30/gluconolactonase/LRE family protein [Planctomycetaceae bacterium]